MEFIQRLFLYITLMCLPGLFIGLLKPWVMLWWEDTQNRKRVIKVYGTPAAVSYVLYWLTVLF